MSAVKKACQMFCSLSYCICLIMSLTGGANSLKVLAALIMFQAAEVTGALLSSGEVLTTATHTAA